MSKEQHFLDEHSITNSLIYELSQLLRNNFYKKFDRIYERAIDDFEKYGGRGPLELFQRSLENIGRWNKDRKTKEYKYLIKSNKIDREYLNKLINSVHTAYVEEYTRRLKMKIIPDVKIKVPNNITFICKCYENIARELWRKAYLFSRQVTSVIRQKNINAILTSIDASILKTIRDSMPLKEILHMSKYAAETDDVSNNNNTEWVGHYNYDLEDKEDKEEDNDEEDKKENDEDKSHHSEELSSDIDDKSEETLSDDDKDSEKSEEDVMAEMASILGLPSSLGGMFRNNQKEIKSSKIEEIDDDDEPINLNSSEDYDNDDDKEIKINTELKENKKSKLDIDNDEDKKLFEKFMKFQQFMRMQNE